MNFTFQFTQVVINVGLIASVVMLQARLRKIEAKFTKSSGDGQP